MTESHIPHVFATVLGIVNITSLSRRQWAVIVNPVDDKLRPQYGKRLLVRGEKNLFLQPGEQLTEITEVSVLTADKALLVQAIKSFKDDSTGKVIHRAAGEKWLIPGPKEYWPPLEVKVLKTVSAFLQLGSINLFNFDAFILVVLLFIIGLYIFWRLLGLFF